MLAEILHIHIDIGDLHSRLVYPVFPVFSIGTPVHCSELESGLLRVHVRMRVMEVKTPVAAA